MSSILPPAKKLCVEKNVKVNSKAVRFENPDIVHVINNYCESKDLVAYDVILKQLQKGDVDHEQCVLWFKQLEDNIVVMNNLSPGDRTKLINVLVKANWIWKSTSDVVRHFCSFIECLLTFSTNYASPVIQNLVPLFISKIKESVTEVGKANPEEDCMFASVHRLFRNIVKQVPMASEVLIDYLKAKFPVDVSDRHAQACYVTNLFEAIKYLPSSRKEILAVIFHRLKTLDLDCPWSQIQEAERTSISEETDDLTTSKMKHKQANLLDFMMKATFNFIYQTCHTDNVMDSGKTRILFKELLSIFHRQLVNVEVTCHVQFVIFYICSYHLKLCRGFFDYLWKQVIDPKLSNATRKWAACYIGSFIVRHARIPASTVRDCLQLMKDWVHEYMQKCKPAKDEQVDVHAPFYGVCQAMFYVIAYRIDELVNIPDGPRFLSTILFNSIISSPLRPLAFCSPNIVGLFAEKASKNQLTYCYPYIATDDDYQALKLFFPFDPYLLARSGEYIEPIYRVYIEQYFYDHSDEENDSISDGETFHDIFDEDTSTRDSLQSFILD